MTEEMLSQKSFQREKETIKLEYWYIMDTRELNLCFCHRLRTTVSFRCASIKIDGLKKYFSCECVELMQDYGGAYAPIWKHPFIPNKREVQNILIIFFELMPLYGLCACVLERPVLEVESILILSITTPKVMCRYADDSIFCPSDHNVNLSK